MPPMPSMGSRPEQGCSRHAGGGGQLEVPWEVTATRNMGWGVQSSSLSSVDRWGASRGKVGKDPHYKLLEGGREKD